LAGREKKKPRVQLQQDKTNSEPLAEEISKEEEKGAAPPFGGGEGGEQGEMGCGASKTGVTQPTPEKTTQNGDTLEQGQNASKTEAEDAATAQEERDTEVKDASLDEQLDKLFTVLVGVDNAVDVLPHVLKKVGVPLACTVVATTREIERKFYHASPPAEASGRLDW